MPNTYTQIHLHVVFSVQNRQSLIAESWKERLYQYISGIIKNNGHKMLAIGGMPDHIHILFGLRPSQSLSEIMKVVKGESAKWINQNGFISGKFSWQEGYGAFSYSKSHIPAVVNYILTQEKHHKKTSFIEEYKELLEKFGLEYQEQFLFQKI